MFTIKFYGEKKNAEVRFVIASETYSVETYQGHQEILIKGDRYQIGGKEGYRTCYIENSAGKTIECLSGMLEIS